MVAAFRGALTDPLGDERGEEEDGVPQLRTMLLSAHSAGIELEHLDAGSIYWDFFQQKPDVLDKLQLAIRKLKTLRLYIDAKPGKQVRGWDMEDEARACAKYLEYSGRMKEFLASAKELEYLELYVEKSVSLVASPRIFID